MPAEIGGPVQRIHHPVGLRVRTVFDLFTKDTLTRGDAGQTLHQSSITPAITVVTGPSTSRRSQSDQNLAADEHECDPTKDEQRPVDRH